MLFIINENPETNSKNYVTLFSYQIYNFIFIKIRPMKKLYYTANALLILMLVLLGSCKKTDTITLTENKKEKKKVIEYKKPETSAYQITNTQD